jgi:chemotaxis protein methyltransferase CheR
MVTFSCLNLAEDVYPSLWNDTNAMDVIFCRNVLMYFSPERAKQVVHKLHRALVDGGWLIVGISEISQALFSEFVPVNFPGTVLYRKEGHRTSRASATTFQTSAASHAPPAPISGPS